MPLARATGPLSFHVDLQMPTLDLAPTRWSSHKPKIEGQAVPRLCLDGWQDGFFYYYNDI